MKELGHVNIGFEFRSCKYMEDKNECWKVPFIVGSKIFTKNLVINDFIFNKTFIETCFRESTVTLYINEDNTILSYIPKPNTRSISLIKALNFATISQIEVCSEKNVCKLK